MVVIVDYDAGNVRSVQRACSHVGLDATITSDPEQVLAADKVIFPGVGSAASAVGTLRERGLDEALKAFYAKGNPLLGICLGLQIALEHTQEGNEQCLGLIEGACLRFDPKDKLMKVPHIGWNQVTLVADHPLLKQVQSGDEFYFVHSYYACPGNPAEVFGTTDYGGVEFASAIGKDNFFATQFHLEKSGEFGLKLLSEFVTWQGGSC